MSVQDCFAGEPADCCYEPATSLLRKMAEGEVSSETLVRQFIARRNLLNPLINAIVTTCDEQALVSARAADAVRARGDICGPLHGLPMTVKDTWETRDILTTSGSRLHHDHLPSSHADTIERLTKAGGIIIGKTNVPVMAADIQTFNPLFGLTRNPWHTEHTCGGSSGGAAAALAAGMTPVEIGSDIGGSIRIPAHFCGVYGHKPTRDIVSLRGHIPGAPGTWSQPDLAEAGPLARSVDDLELMLDVLAGPRAIDTPHWKLQLPPPSFSDLRGLRIGYWFDDPACPLDDQLAGHYHSLIGKLQSAGANVVDVRSSQSRLLNMNQILPLYFNLLGSMIGMGMPAGERFRMKLLAIIMPLLGRRRVTAGITEFARGINQSFRRWLYHNEMREKLRFESLDLFAGMDVLLTPVTPTVAIPHDLSMPIARRRIKVNSQSRPYSDQFVWIALATMLGLPATVAPAGLTREGLPFGIQIISGFGRDRSTLHFARLLEPFTGGCQAQGLVS